MEYMDTGNSHFKLIKLFNRHDQIEELAHLQIIQMW